MDSIVDKVQLVDRRQDHFVVRWVGYEDVYNTVEPEARLLGTAVLMLYNRKDIYTASQSSGVLLRRSKRNSNEIVMPISPRLEPVRNTPYMSTLHLLNEQLKREEISGRYFPEIGFYA